MRLQDYETTRLLDFETSRLKNQPVPWHCGTGWNGALDNTTMRTT